MNFTINLSEEEVRELFEEKLTEKFPQYKIKDIAFNIKSLYEGDYPNEYKTYKFTGCTIEIEEGIKI